MEIKFNHKPLSCMRQVLTQVQSQEQTQELKLPDGYPDIGRILGCWGQVILRGKEWRRTSMGANGGVLAWVLYAPDDGSEPRVVDAWVPFQSRWDLGEGTDDGVMTVLPLLSEMDARNISARKIILRTGIELLGQAMTRCTAEVASAGEVPEDVQLLTQDYPVDLPVESGERQIQLEENLLLSSDQPALDQIISYELIPTVLEQKVLANRLVFRGIATVNLRYLGNDGKIHKWTIELPFSDYTELDRDYDISASAWIIPTVTALEIDRGEDGQLLLRGSMAAQYVILDRVLLSVTEDAYSTAREMQVSMEQLELPALLDKSQLRIPVSPVTNTNTLQVVDTAFRVGHPYLCTDGEKMEIGIAGQCQVLYRGDAEMIECETVRFENRIPYVSAQDNRISLWLGNQCGGENTKGIHEVALREEYPVTAFAFAGRSIPMITGCELGNSRAEDINRPSLILKRAGKDDLWTIAKQYSTTVAAIRTANKLSDEPEEDRILLVPVS